MVTDDLGRLLGHVLDGIDCITVVLYGLDENLGVL